MSPKVMPARAGSRRGRRRRGRRGRACHSGCDAAPLLESVERPLDDVALLVVLVVEVDRPPAARASLLAVAGLVSGLGDHGGDAAGAQVRAVPPGGVRLVTAQRVRSRPRSAGSEPGHPQRAQQRQQLGGVAGLAGRDRNDERPAATVNQRVRLGRQSAAGPPDAVIVRFVPADLRILFIRRSPLCATATSPTSRSRPPAGQRWQRVDAPAPPWSPR